MSELINRQAAIDAIELITGYHRNREPVCQIWYKAKDVYKVLNDLPSAEPERKKGEWVKKEHWVSLPLDCDPMDWDCYDEENHRERKTYWHCSNCGYEGSRDMKPHWNFCPNCGDDMRGDSV